MSSLFRPVSRIALACAAVAAVPACNLVLGLDNFIDCPEDPKCSAIGGSGGASSTTSMTTSSTTSSDTTSSSTSSTTSSETGGSGGTGGAPPMPTCTDGVKNGDETGKDCGGSCSPTAPCPDGDGCMLGTDCISKVCTGNTCIAPKCTDSVQNGTETDADCGGSCPTCADGLACMVPGDCKSAVCTANKCISAGCSDTVQNGTETAIDCGGPACPGCAPGLACNKPEDCESAICQANKCVDYRVWGKRFGDAQNQVIERVATDLIGEAVMLGHFFGTMDVGAGPMTTCDFDGADPLACAGDWVIASVHSDGSPNWSRRLVNQSETSQPRAFTFASRTSSEVLVAGCGNGKIDVGGGMLSPPAACGFNCGAGTVVGKLGTNGAHKWSKRFDSTGGSGTIAALDTALEGSGASVTTGIMAGSANFGGGVLTANFNDVFALKLDTDGNHVWSKRFGDASAQEQCGQSVAIDGAGNVLLAGFFSGGMSFGGATLTSAGGNDLFLAKLSSSGAHVWSKRFGDVQDQSFICGSANRKVNVTVDAAGSVLLTGSLAGSVNFGGGALSAVGLGAFIAKFDLGGAHMWSTSLPGAWVGRAATDVAGAVFITGTSTGMLDIGGTSLAGSGGFVLKLATDGSYLWGKRLAGIDGWSVAASTTGHLLLSGALVGTENFGGTPLVTAGGSDAFIAKILNP